MLYGYDIKKIYISFEHITHNSYQPYSHAIKLFISGMAHSLWTPRTEVRRFLEHRTKRNETRRVFYFGGGCVVLEEFEETVKLEKTQENKKNQTNQANSYNNSQYLTH